VRGATVCRYYNQYYGIAYPLPKLDLVAIPNLACGGMGTFVTTSERERELITHS
jgi:aminopeptidase N